MEGLSAELVQGEVGIRLTGRTTCAIRPTSACFRYGLP